MSGEWAAVVSAHERCVQLDRQFTRLLERMDAHYRASGAAIRAWRETEGIGLRKLARQLGISAAYLSDVETGKRSAENVLWKLTQRHPGGA